MRLRPQKFGSANKTAYANDPPDTSIYGAWIFKQEIHITKAQTELNPNQILRLITTSLNDDKAENIHTIPLDGKSAMADYMVVASGASSRQVAAMAEHLEFKLKQNNVDILGLEGLRQADWVLIDANDVIVHIFRPEVREFYGIERMWTTDISSEIVKIGSDV